MKKEDKELLIRDLCSRLPYQVFCKVEDEVEPLQLLAIDIKNSAMSFQKGMIVLLWDELPKPYLRPLSDMTEEEQMELSAQIVKLTVEHIEDETVGFNVKAAKSSAFEIDFYNSHHLDYNGLIPMGLAIEATKEMYK